MSVKSVEGLGCVVGALSKTLIASTVLGVLKSVGKEESSQRKGCTCAYLAGGRIAPFSRAATLLSLLHYQQG